MRSVRPTEEYDTSQGGHGGGWPRDPYVVDAAPGLLSSLDI
jgi:hypothetical protein